MLERFLLTFPTAGATAPIPHSTLASLQDELGGAVFGGGLLRVHTVDSARGADACVAAGFTEFAGRIQCFAFDWLGRQFSLDATRGERNDPGVLMFEPGTAEALEVPATFSTFFDEELVDYADAALASEFFSQWLEASGSVPAFNECAGYRTPLFVGGEDTISNLEITEMDVYWHLIAELRSTTRGVPPSSQIRRVDID
ncbi:DUF1851 domain-containing protein [Agromyces sp. SYSU K20354]|uniref:T6SS immunity protein Tdi1 domain-containing protein n=1 Tax=Agromyces cavernae TaxID=2898659 RepID=UPI001E544A1A|nr:T6SS immunity protein Tdi1 domain-containing protein [Agromyces cavernae]MCD2443706.1 DUF1851 domain-containing protein [Agromyces cavernae]